MPAAAVNAFSFHIAIQPTSAAGRRCDKCPSASSAKKPICDSRNVTGIAGEGHERHVVVVVIAVIVSKKAFSLCCPIREGGESRQAGCWRVLTRSGFD